MKSTPLIPIFLFLIQFSSFAQTGMKEAYKESFSIGAALNYRQVNGQETKSSAVLEKHFNSITGENLMKWGPIHPELGKYNFDPADKFVSMGEKLNASFRTH